jgi:hypothetical protein
VRNASGIDADEALASFDVSSALRRAASRDGAYAPVNVTYEAVIKRSGLSAKDKRFWLGLA